MLIAISGCATSKNQITAERPLSSFPDSNGVITGSFLSDETRYTRVFYFRSMDGNGIDQSIAYSPHWAIPTDDSLFAFSLPPGRYEFYDFRLAAGNNVYWTAADEFSIPFTVEQGETAYLGEIRTIPLRGKNLFGITVPAGGYFEIGDLFKRDIPNLQSQFPDVNWAAPVNKVLREGDVPEGLVIFRARGPVGLAL